MTDAKSIEICSHFFKIFPELTDDKNEKRIVEEILLKAFEQTPEVEKQGHLRYFRNLANGPFASKRRMKRKAK